MLMETILLAFHLEEITNSDAVREKCFSPMNKLVIPSYVVNQDSAVFISDLPEGSNSMPLSVKLSIFNHEIIDDVTRAESVVRIAAASSSSSMLVDVALSSSLRTAVSWRANSRLMEKKNKK